MQDMYSELLAPLAEWDLTTRVGAMVGGAAVTVDGSATLREAAERMAGEAVGCLVVDEPGRTPRVITERDVVHALADGADPDAALAGDTACDELISAHPDDTVLDVIQLMADCAIRHVPIRSGHGDEHEIVGMISARDIVRGLAR